MLAICYLGVLFIVVESSHTFILSSSISFKRFLFCIRRLAVSAKSPLGVKRANSFHPPLKEPKAKIIGPN